MDNESSLPGIPENASEVYTALRRALGDINISQDERDAIATYANRELPSLLDTAVTSYLVLGSYRNEYHKRLRAVEHELGNRRTDTHAVVLGDTAEITVDERVLPAFPVKFNLLATSADMIVMVMEKESGGEGVELGRIADGPYFKYSHILPRDYAGFTSDTIESPDEARKAAVEIWFNDTLSRDEKEAAIERLIENNSVDGTEFDDLIDFLKEREKSDQDLSAYSWVHLSDFRKFERADRCYPWMTENELREQANALPGPSHAEWPVRSKD